jgi:endoglucanase
MPKNAIELTKVMGNGINLGNTMEAYGHFKFGTNAATSDYETAWGQPVTTQEIISSFKKAGFDSLRVPVAWTNMMAFEKGDYTINAAYLNRVEEIINYALKENMYVVLNDHWDGSWWGMFGSATPETRKAAMDLYVSMWTQIATKYKDIDNHLIFESANEELGARLNDTDIAKDSGTLDEAACFAQTNKINQTFVDTVRKAGGNNANRFLLIAGYNTDFDKTLDPRFVMPKDTQKGKLLISVHYYNPSNYCINSSVNNWGSKDDYQTMNDLFKKMTKFTAAGYGVIIGEYAVALNQDGSVKKNTVDYLGNLLNNCDLYGYCPMLWDCSSLFKRTELSFMDKGAAKLYMDHRLANEKGKSKKDIETAAQAALTAAASKAQVAAGVAAGQAVAWIMFSSGDWSVSYSVGDKYNPASKTEGLVTVDPTITGPGTYTASLDFSGLKAGSITGVAFSALGIANGETLFPGYVIDIKEIKVNDTPIKLSGIPYTASDDGTCTRVNLYNAWVTKIPADIRMASGDPKKASAIPVNPASLVQVKKLTVTFEYRAQ